MCMCECVSVCGGGGGGGGIFTTKKIQACMYKEGGAKRGLTVQFTCSTRL